jgi:hypothetical protein
MSRGARSGDTESQGRDNKGNFIPYKRQLVTGWIKAQTTKNEDMYGTPTRDGSGKKRTATAIAKEWMPASASTTFELIKPP